MPERWTEEYNMVCRQSGEYFELSKTIRCKITSYYINLIYLIMENVRIKETLHVKNAGPLSDTGVIIINPLTVLIGDSASGKSTLMKIIILMRYIYKRHNIRSYIKNSNVDDKVFYIRFNDMLRDDMRLIINKDTFIEYTVEINGHSYTLKYENGKLTPLNVIPNDDLIFSKEAWISEMRSAIAPIISRGTLAKNASLGFYFDETLSDFDIATNNIKHFDLNYIGLKMDVQKGGNNQKKFVLRPQDGKYGPFELKNASSGIQTTTPLLAITKYFTTDFSFKAAQKRNIIDFLFEKDLTTKYHPEIELTDLTKLVHLHIEEPELSLDPTSQIRFVNELIRLAFYAKNEDRQVGLVMATHSPYIVNDLNLLMKAFDCDTTIDGSKLDYDQLSVYQIKEGRAIDLKIRNIHYINTDRLSEDINAIYDTYQSLKDNYDEGTAGK